MLYELNVFKTDSRLFTVSERVLILLSSTIFVYVVMLANLLTEFAVVFYVAVYL